MWVFCVVNLSERVNFLISNKFVAYWRSLSVAVFRHRDKAIWVYMNLTWILLGFVGWTLGLLFVLTLFRMSGDQDRSARRHQKRLDPYSDVTITQAGTT